MPRKKRRGRKKKRGPKRKKPIRNGRRGRWPFRYWVIKCCQGKKLGDFGKFQTLEGAYDKLKELTANDDDIIFERTVQNGGALFPVRDEYLILERNPDGTKKNPSFRNEYGKLIEAKVSSPDWVVVDKVKARSEETFWVFSYDKKRDRKTFKWVYDNLIIGKIQDEYDIKRIIIYGNKLVIKHDDATYDIVFCKNEDEAIKFNNLIVKFVKADKVKQVCFLGKIIKYSDAASAMLHELMAYTGMSNRQLNRQSNRH